MVFLYSLAGIAVVSLFYKISQVFSGKTGMKVLAISTAISSLVAGVIAMNDASSGYITREAVFIIIMLIFVGPMFLAGGIGLLIARFVEGKRNGPMT